MSKTSVLRELTPEQTAQIPSFVEKRIQMGWRTGTLTHAEWDQWETAAAACYGYAGVPWHGNVVRVPSPFVAALAAPIADYVIKQLLKKPAVRSAVGSAVDAAVDSAVDAAVRSAVGSAVDAAVGSAVRSAVRSAVDAAVDSAVRDSVNYWYGAMLTGQHWPWYSAYLAYFRDIVQLPLPGDLWDRSRAYETTQIAGNWHLYDRFTIVSDRPTDLHLEQVAGWPGYRLHNETGPAIAWSNGDAIYAWHGTQVPADLILTGWDTARILQETNTEVRRCAIERMGWDWFVKQAELKQVGATIPDPGNAEQTLALYDIPRGLLDSPVRVLLCANGTAERDGTRHRFGLTVPADIKTPLAAAAWTFGCTPTQYAQLERAT